VRGTARRVATVVVVCAVVAPALRDVDSFPLSTYPMYASERARVATFPTAVGVVAGAEQRLPIDVIADTDDPLIATSRVRSAIDAGAADALCAEIAARAATDVEADVDAIEVVTETHDSVALAAGRPSLLARTVHARCTP
jgi:hypothetical protein